MNSAGRLTDEQLAWPIAATIVVRVSPTGQPVLNVDGSGVSEAVLADALLTLVQVFIRRGPVTLYGLHDHDGDDDDESERHG